MTMRRPRVRARKADATLHGDIGIVPGRQLIMLIEQTESKMNGPWIVSMTRPRWFGRRTSRRQIKKASVKEQR